jgi:hypothetical protein
MLDKVSAIPDKFPFVTHITVWIRISMDAASFSVGDSLVLGNHLG